MVNHHPFFVTKENWFLPNKKRAQLMNYHMHQALLKSLMHIDKTIKEAKKECHALRKAINILVEGGELPPESFGWYYSAVFNFINDQDDDGMICLKNLAEPMITNTSSIHVSAYVKETHPRETAMYLRSLGEADGFKMAEPEMRTYFDFKKMFAAALEVLEAHVPHLHQEIQLLIRHVIVVKAKHDSQMFYGMSPYQLWRLVFLNIICARTLPSMLETLIHESAHVYLFGACTHEPLTLNPSNETYYSAIRQCERPMDGIYHAAFVTARVVWAFKEILKQSQLHSRYEDEIKSIIATNEKYHHECLKVVNSHGKLSKTGQKILDDIHLAEKAVAQHNH